MNKLLHPLLLVLVFSSAASGQERRYVHFDFSPDFETRLKDQVRMAAELEQMISYLKKVVPDLLKKNGIDLKDLQLQPDGSGLSSLDPALKKNLEKLQRELQANAVPAEQLKSVEKIVENFKASKPEPKAPTEKPKTRLPPPPPAQPVQPPEKEKELGRAARDLMRDVERSQLGDFLRNSRAWQRGLEELQRGTTFEGKGMDLSLLEKITGRLKWPENLNLNLSDGFLERIRSFNPPSLPNVRVNLPRIGGFNPLPSVSLPGMPSPGAISWQAILAVGLVLAASALAWQLLTRASKNSTAMSGWRLGPWPVAPGRIASPAEFIKAFDYLAFLRLGLAARTWNHRRIAERFENEAKGESAPAARRLMRLYEEARYAPLAEWSQTVLAGARRDLCLLAGVPAA